MNRLTTEQRRRNKSRDDEWQLAENHRSQVTRRILALAGGGEGRLCILGAGNANDLDLRALTAAFREVHLVDVDGEALQRGVARQLPEESGLADGNWQGGDLRRAAGGAKIRLHPAVDVTGIWDTLAKLETTPADAAPAELLDRAANVGPLLLPGPFDVAVSAGLLSQLIDGVVLSLPPTSASFMQLLLSVRSGHLRLLARLTAPGGHGLLITDFVSAATAPELTSLSDDHVGELADRLAATGNFFHGINPVFLPQLFEQDSMLRSLISRVNHRGHWIWNQRSRRYAVLAIEFERRQSNSGTP
ncbi:MAG TPA: hypothetical protein VG826_28120 [Pirellulales bacterium]|nr:hypothetical protein [Pirellulales bacterium]